MFVSVIGTSDLCLVHWFSLKWNWIQLRQFTRTWVCNDWRMLNRKCSLFKIPYNVFLHCDTSRFTNCTISFEAQQFLVLIEREYSIEIPLASIIHLNCHNYQIIREHQFWAFIWSNDFSFSTRTITANWDLNFYLCQKWYLLAFSSIERFMYCNRPQFPPWIAT